MNGNGGRLSTLITNLVMSMTASSVSYTTW